MHWSYTCLALCLMRRFLVVKYYHRCPSIVVAKIAVAAAFFRSTQTTTHFLLLISAHKSPGSSRSLLEPRGFVGCGDVGAPTKQTNPPPKSCWCFAIFFSSSTSFGHTQRRRLAVSYFTLLLDCMSLSSSSSSSSWTYFLPCLKCS